MALAVASTVVLMRMLVEQDRLATRAGHVAVGWLIVEDLLTVIALVVLPVLAAGGGGATDFAAFGLPLAVALGKAALFAVLVWVVGSPVVSRLLERMARTRSEELFTLMVFVLALGIASIAAEGFHVSVALGAFFAGLVVGRSRFGPQATSYMAPFRDVFSALFFVSVGMLFNPSFVLEHPAMVAAALAIVLVVKPAVALAIVMVLRDRRGTAGTVAVGLAQIGEFSFILATLGTRLGLLPPEGLDTLVVTAILSIAVNPLLFRALRGYAGRLRETAAPVDATPLAAATAPTPATGDAQVVVAGTGELARRVVVACVDEGIRTCVIANDLDALDVLRAHGAAAVFGDPGRTEVLRAAHLERARAIVVITGTLAGTIAVCTAARALQPRIAIVATAATGAEHAWLTEFGASFVCDALDSVTEALLRSLRQTL
jgi:CPA2 family monovalent cation:H+ antiporter-2